MKLAIVALVLAVCLVGSTEAWWGMYGGMMGMYSPYMWGGMGMYGWGKRASAETMPSIEESVALNRTECVYVYETSMLSCKGSSEIVECEVSLRWDMPKEYALFGLAECIEETPVASHFRILPRKMDNSNWMNNLVEMNNGEEKRMSLYYSDDITDMGMKVLDKTCFTRMESLLNNSIRREKVFLDDETTAVIRGDLLMTEKLPELKEKLSKRYWGYGGLYGGLYGMGYGGFGYGGMGYGGFGYYGKRSGLPSIESLTDLKTFSKDNWTE